MELVTGASFKTGCIPSPTKTPSKVKMVNGKFDASFSFDEHMILLSTNPQLLKERAEALPRIIWDLEENLIKAIEEEQNASKAFEEAKKTSRPKMNKQGKKIKSQALQAAEKAHLLACNNLTQARKALCLVAATEKDRIDELLKRNALAEQHEHKPEELLSQRSEKEKAEISSLVSRLPEDEKALATVSLMATPAENRPFYMHMINALRPVVESALEEESKEYKTDLSLSELYLSDEIPVPRIQLKLVSASSMLKAIINQIQSLIDNHKTLKEAEEALAIDKNYASVEKELRDYLRARYKDSPDIYKQKAAILNAKLLETIVA